MTVGLTLFTIIYFTLDSLPLLILLPQIASQMFGTHSETITESRLFIFKFFVLSSLIAPNRWNLLQFRFTDTILFLSFWRCENAEKLNRIMEKMNGSFFVSTRRIFKQRTKCMHAAAIHCIVHKLWLLCILNGFLVSRIHVYVVPGEYATCRLRLAFLKGKMQVNFIEIRLSHMHFSYLFVIIFHAFANFYCTMRIAHAGVCFWFVYFKSHFLFSSRFPTFFVPSFYIIFAFEIEYSSPFSFGFSFTPSNRCQLFSPISTAIHFRWD